MDLEFCDFVVFIEVDFYIERIYRSKEFWQGKMFEKLKKFFYLAYLPELTFRHIKDKKVPINLMNKNVSELFS